MVSEANHLGRPLAGVAKRRDAALALSVTRAPRQQAERRTRSERRERAK